MSPSQSAVETENQDRSHPELPPGVPPPPGIDREFEAQYLRHWGDNYAEAGMPLEDTATNLPLDPERAVEQRHGALQQRVEQWSQAAQNNLTARRDQVREGNKETSRQLEALDEQIAALEEEIKRYDEETSTPEAGRRFDRGFPAAWLLFPFLLSILEYPVVEPAVGRLFDVTGRAQTLATVAIVVGQILVYEATGAMAQRWRSTTGTVAERRTVAGVTLAGLALCVVFMVGLTLVRVDQLPDDEAITAALLLFIGVQAGFALLSMLGGWRATAVEGSGRRSLVREVERLEDQRGLLQEQRSAGAEEADYLDGLLRAWSLWIRKHKDHVRGAYLAEIHSFRAYLKFSLAKQGKDEPVYRLEQIRLPTFPIPVDVADLGMDDDLETEVDALDLRS